MASKWIASFAALAVAASTSLAQSPLPADVASERMPVVAAAAPIPPEEIPDPGVNAPPRFSSLPPIVPIQSAAPISSKVQPTVFEPQATNYDDNQFSAHAEYLLWFFKQSHVPVLFGSIPPSLANQADLPPGSIIPVFGGNHDSIDYRGQSGGRFGVGYWFDKEQNLGLDVDYFQLEQASRHFSAQSNPNGLPIIGPTFFDPVANQETLVLFSDPGMRAASLNLSSDARFSGVEANFRNRLAAVFADHLEFLAGFRYVQFDEDLHLNGTSVATDPNGVSVAYEDSFSVRNRFYGPQIGLSSDFTYERLFLNLKGKFAIGEMNETASIGGSTTLTGPVSSVGPGGILSQPSNIGSHSRTVFTFLPEITVNTGVQLNDHLRAFVGYNLIYLDKLQRAGALIDGVDGTQVRSLTLQPNMSATRPAFEFSDGRFWAYGLNVGLEFSF